MRTVGSFSGALVVVAGFAQVELGPGLLREIRGGIWEPFRELDFFLKIFQNCTRTSRSRSWPNSTRRNALVTTRAPVVGPNGLKQTPQQPQTRTATVPSRGRQNVKMSDSFTLLTENIRTRTFQDPPRPREGLSRPILVSNGRPKIRNILLTRLPIRISN